ncbi:MAG: hypothetical protein KF869_03795 [Phycisphaeraceae bacterium]|nr:hypothetical protein [Phycisphaeraceae bacterium]
MGRFALLCTPRRSHQVPEKWLQGLWACGKLDPEPERAGRPVMAVARRTFLAVGAAFVLLRVAGGDASAGDNLVNNGGFEQGFAGWNVPPNAPPGNPNAANFQTPTDSPHSGLRYAQLSSTPLLFISQGVQGTVPGTDYELEFWVRNPTSLPPGFGHSLTIRWEGVVVANPLIGGPDGVNWTMFTIPLTSNFSGSFLEFGQTAFPGELHIDTISVRQVPAPSAISILAVGGFVVLRRRRW